MANRSTFPQAFDSFKELLVLPPERYQDADRFQILMKKSSKTPEEITEMNNLASILRDYYIDPETWNKFCDCLVNIENFTYSKITEYFQYKGDYVSTTLYKTFNTVRYNGEIYMALQDTQGNLPTDETKWLKIASKGDKGERGIPGIGLTFIGDYDNAFAYNVNNAVNYSNKIYYCIQASIGHLPTDTNYWKLFMTPYNYASDINIADAGSYYDSTQVEGALQEAGNKINDLNTNITKVSDDLVSHKADITNKTDETKGASLIGLKPITGLAGDNVRTAIQNLFLGASDVKTKVATAITGKGVPASSSDTGEQLADKIGQINTGKKWAKNTVTVISNTFTVNDLNFKPSTVILYHLDNPQYYIIFVSEMVNWAHASGWNGSGNIYTTSIAITTNITGFTITRPTIEMPDFPSNMDYICFE
jgi:hypothetical protein